MKFVEVYVLVEPNGVTVKSDELFETKKKGQAFLTLNKMKGEVITLQQWYQNMTRIASLK